MKPLSMKIVSIPELTPPRDIAGVILFGGDRLAVCDEALVVEEDSKQIGIATIAPNGEDGSGPAIVGLWVKESHRRQGLGLILLEDALLRCRERGWNRVRLDAVTPGGLSVARRVRKDFASMLEVRDCCGSLGPLLML